MDQYIIDNYTALVEGKVFTWKELQMIAEDRDDPILAELCKKHGDQTKMAEEFNPPVVSAVVVPENKAMPAAKPSAPVKAAVKK